MLVGMSGNVGELLGSLLRVFSGFELVGYRYIYGKSSEFVVGAV